MGLTSSGDILCACTDEALAGIPSLHKLVDDLIVYSETKRQLMERVYMVMEHCRKHGITLSASKAQVGKEVKFAGFMVACNGIKADPEKIKALPRTSQCRRTSPISSPTWGLQISWASSVLI